MPDGVLVTLIKALILASEPQRNNAATLSTFQIQTLVTAPNANPFLLSPDDLWPITVTSIAELAKCFGRRPYWRTNSPLGISRVAKRWPGGTASTKPKENSAPWSICIFRIWVWR